MTVLALVFLVAFLAGLALAVHSMLHGVERWRRRRSANQSPVFNPPTAAALAIGFGATGYLLTTRSGAGWPLIVVISSLVATAAFIGMIVLMAKWALKPVPGVPAEEDKIYGQIATVSRAITPGTPGEITYQAWNRTHTVAAQSVDALAIPVGTEVAIEALEDGVARVELWSIVEQRI